MSIAVQTYTEDWRGAWNTVLNNYFDGSSHSFGASGMSFPDCDIVFDRPQLGEHLSKPLIVVSAIEGSTLTRKARVAGGFYCTHSVPTVLTVFTADKADIWDVNYNVQDLLAVVLSGAGGELRTLGVRVVFVGGVIALNLDPSHGIQASQRILTTQVSIEYPVEG